MALQVRPGGIGVQVVQPDYFRLYVGQDGLNLLATGSVHIPPNGEVTDEAQLSPLVGTMFAYAARRVPHIVGLIVQQSHADVRLDNSTRFDSTLIELVNIARRAVGNPLAQVYAIEDASGWLAQLIESTFGPGGMGSPG